MQHPQPNPSALKDGRLRHQLQVQCASEVGAFIRVLNCYAVMRADVLEGQCETHAGAMRLSVTSQGLSALQADTLRLRIENLEGVELASIIALDAEHSHFDGASHV